MDQHLLSGSQQCENAHTYRKHTPGNSLLTFMVTLQIHLKTSGNETWPIPYQIQLETIPTGRCLLWYGNCESLPGVSWWSHCPWLVPQWVSWLTSLVWWSGADVSPALPPPCATQTEHKYRPRNSSNVHDSKKGYWVYQYESCTQNHVALLMPFTCMLQKSDSQLGQDVWGKLSALLNFS